jgi:FlaA1/EpsC-like NDP-sugar epimerase
VSTDKAANPTSVLGYTKAIAEGLTTQMAHKLDKPYVCVRFGNVLGSRGSVLPAFTEQIARGGPLTVTDAEATRYMMTIPEAAHLVVQAGSIGKPGDVLVLNMGEPVRILEIAERLIERSGRQDISIEFTGLRKGEKLNEDLFGIDEHAVPSAHPSISVTRCDPTDFRIVDELLATPAQLATRALEDFNESGSATPNQLDMSESRSQAALES